MDALKARKISECDTTCSGSVLTEKILYLGPSSNVGMFERSQLREGGSSTVTHAIAKSVLM